MARRGGGEAIPAEFICPLTKDVMKDPVMIAGGGQSYDKKALEIHV